MLTLIVFIILLSILVLVHELGHFIAAKKIGVKVEEFGLGYPPRIFGQKIGETIYSLNALPFGGFVRLYGEDEESKSQSSRVSKNKNLAFFSRSKPERLVILVAGVAMNFILAVVVITYFFTQGVMVPNGVMISEILPKTPAAYAGIVKGDIIRMVNGDKIDDASALIAKTKQYAGKRVLLEIKRCGETRSNCRNLSISLIPRKVYPKGEGAMGVSVVTDFVKKQYTWWEAPFFALVEAFKTSWLIVKGVGTVLWQLFTFQGIPRDVAGPVGIYQVTGQAWQFGGLLGVLQLLGLLSLNLAVINILPIPALDGGRFFLVLAEAVVGRKRIVKVEKVAQSIGMALILTLIVLVTLNDLGRVSIVQNFLQNFKPPF